MRAWIAVGLALCLPACNRSREPTGNGQSPSAVNTIAAPASKVNFAIETGPGPVVKLECRQDECTWQQRKSATAVRRIGDALLVRFTGRIGNSVHRFEEDHPAKWSPVLRTEWKSETAYFLCSQTRPSALARIGRDPPYRLDVIQIYGPPGFQNITANEYMLLCHGLAPGMWNADTLKRLGYRDVDYKQSDYATLDEGLAALTTPPARQNAS